MDGYAMGGGDELEEYTVIETVPAGSFPKNSLPKVLQQRL
jgi:molybdopterin biosynthesis enzyme